MTSRTALAALLAVATVAGSLFTSVARADDNEVAQAAPPPVYAPAPPPPPVVYNPGATAAPPPAYAPAPPPYPYPYPPRYEYPAKLPYEEGRPIPQYYHAETHVRRGLVIGGAVTFGVLYVLSFTVANAANDGGRNHDLDGLYVPGVGPFIAAANVHDSSGILLMDGLGQIAGLAMLVSGIAFPKTELVRNDLAEVHIVPRVTKDSSGLALVGTF